MDRLAYLNTLAEAQPTPMRVRSFENKNVIIHRNLANHQGLTTEVWNAWLQKVLLRFSGFEPVIEVDRFGNDPDIRFFRESELQDAIHFILTGSKAPEAAVE
ncbi:hypothetical protein [Lacticaseibacillus camelliae]|uniref:Uncharacterized protein n=1 Tax=Lacticaseibacillus camelliae DSM 22697 = JCM 13995 TaxID=1423730 RepID=A0A0R2FNI0_9LACO|nr:hypothetical protein [Lacticaseibacillus camelliae]KRN25860.1 hypothetical protein FC75_GL002216 [Lacticaseibacillus camelliae DSM 22697 = JCM 13995]